MAASGAGRDDLLIDKSSVQFGDMIGRGGYSQVWSVNLKTATGEVVKAAAKKVRNIDVKEVQVMKDIKHSNVISFYGALLDDTDTYIIMELAENGDLRQYLSAWNKEKKTRLPIKLVWKWTFEAACGINFLHEIHHTHRDIKSLNYLVMKDHTVKLGDLGLAKAMDITQETSGVRGTCRWMAPEVIKEQKRSVKSDVFSFGVVVWEIVTTEIPFAEKRGDFQVMNAVCTGKRPVIPDDCPQQLRQLIEKCWQDDYRDRPDMGTVCRILEQCIHREQSCEELVRQFQGAGIDELRLPIQASDEDTAMDTLSGSHAHGTSEVPIKIAKHAISTLGAASITFDLRKIVGLQPPDHIGAEINLDTDNSKDHQDPGIQQKLYNLPAGDIDMTSVSPHSSRQGVKSQPIDDDTNTSTNTVAMYKMCHVPRGYCFIINNIDFKVARANGHKRLNNREGSEVDYAKLEYIFTKFKYHVEYGMNLDAHEMYNALDDLRRRDHSPFDAFVCCILTHGKLGELAGCEGRYLKIQEILSLFTAEKCPSLRGKPKMFFIQACQGVVSQEKHNLQQDAPTPPQVTGLGAALDQTIPNHADFLLGFATVPGHVSYRNTVLGSWYVSILVEKLDRLHENEDLMSILTEVNRKLSKESAKIEGGEFGQIPAPVSTLRKKVFFTMWESIESKRK